jgi:hypothetical protein
MNFDVESNEENVCVSEGIASRKPSKMTLFYDEGRRELSQWENRTYLCSHRGFVAQQDSSQASSVPGAVPHLFHYARR